MLRDWKHEYGPNSAEQFHHPSGWMIATVGGNSGSAAAMRWIIWSPKVFGPDETSTCKYRKAWPFTSNILSFPGPEQAEDFWFVNQLVEMTPRE